MKRDRRNAAAAPNISRSADRGRDPHERHPRLLSRPPLASPNPVMPAAPDRVSPTAAQPEITADQLTPRQREVVRLISRGCTNAEIADLLVVTRGTAANHV